MTDLTLGYGLGFAELYDRDGLVRLDRAFVAHLVGATSRCMTGWWRRAPMSRSPRRSTKGRIRSAGRSRPACRGFPRPAVRIETEIRELQARHDELAPLYSVKRLFVQRRAVKGVKEDAAAALDGAQLAPRRLTSARSSRRDAAILAWERRYAAQVVGLARRRGGERRGATHRDRVRRLGDAVTRGQGTSTGAGCCSRCRTGST